MRGPRTPRCGRELSELAAISNGSLLIRDGVLDEVGPSRRLEHLSKARDAVEINAAGRVVMPGFVDSHTHLLWPPPGADDSRAAHEIRARTAAGLQVRARQHLEAMARHGTTTVEIKAGCGLDESAETKLLRVAAALKSDPIESVAAFLLRAPVENGTAEWMASEFLSKISRRRWARFVDLAWNPAPAAVPQLAHYLQAARRLGFRSKIHAGPMDCAGAMTMAARELAVSVEHVEYARPADASLLAGSATMATLLPLESFRNGACAPARALIGAGVAVALASNYSPHLGSALSMQAVVSLACRLLRMSPEEAISAATINGAHALACADRVGSLEVGKSADLVILNISDYRQLVENFGDNVVYMTMKGGAFIYKEGPVAPQNPGDLRPQWRV